MAALLLREQGFEVFGLTVPTTPGVAERATKAAAGLALEHHVVREAAEAFAREVIDYFCCAYRCGFTPNPCIACNRWVKYGVLMKQALALGAQWFATGHYARRRIDARGWFELWRGIDRAKDQSYVLYHLSQDQLARVLLPLGEWRKKRVQDEALRRGITSCMEESQEICFIPDNDYRVFLREKFGQQAAASGLIRTVDGRIVGRHEGLPFYTIGQRHGLGIALGYPAYVVGFDLPKNTLIVGAKDALARQEMLVDDLCFIGGSACSDSFWAEVQVRYHAHPARALVRLHECGKEATVIFKESQYAVAPGQAAVFYQGDRVLGGGLIRSAW